MRANGINVSILRMTTLCQRATHIASLLARSGGRRSRERGESRRGLPRSASQLERINVQLYMAQRLTEDGGYEDCEEVRVGMLELLDVGLLLLDVAVVDIVEVRVRSREGKLARTVVVDEAVDPGAVGTTFSYDRGPCRTLGLGLAPEADKGEACAGGPERG